MASQVRDVAEAEFQPSSSSSRSSDPQARSQLTSHDQTNRRRKVPDSVTLNACTACKKARTKCDGARPACKRCVVRNLSDSCHYEVHFKTAKEDMIREIHRLQRQNKSLDEQNDSLRTKNDWIEQIMRALKNDDQGAEIIQRLKRGETHRAIVEWLGRPMTRSTQNLTPASEFQLHEAIEDYRRQLIDDHDPCYWVGITSDGSLINHLIALYMTWIQPAHMLIDEQSFLLSFHDCLDTHCSGSLVNAICALSCQLLHHGWDDDEETKMGIDSLGLKFMDEVRALVKTADPHSMTTCQTYAVMFLVNLGLGNGQAATAHLRLAVEILAERPTIVDSDEVAAWGIRSLHTVWSGLTYQKPSAPMSPQASVFRDVSFDQPEAPWCFYRQPGDVDTAKRPGHALITAFEHAKLFRLVHETILTYCGINGHVTAVELSRLYDEYLHWMEALPERIRTVREEDDPVPHVIFLHLQYHTALINFLQPLLEVDDSGDGYILGLTLQHARCGADLLLQYSRMYSAVYQSPLQLFVVAHICDALVRLDRDSESTPEVTRFCLETLEDARISYALAGPLQRMFCLAIAEYGIALSDDLTELAKSFSQFGPEEMLEACTRITYRQPSSQIVSNLESGVARDFSHIRTHMADGFPPEAEGEGASSGNRLRMQIKSLLNG